MDLKDVLKKIRDELGISQAELGNALHVSYVSVSRWEAGKNRPNSSVLSLLLDYAASQPTSAECRRLLKEAVSNVRPAKPRPAKSGGLMLEHSDLEQLIDDASFPLYICDLGTDEILYVNHRVEEIIGAGAPRIVGRKCYEGLMLRSTPCPNCHKEALTTDHFSFFKAFDPRDNLYHLVQGKRIMWNGRQAHVRYVVDMDSMLGVTARNQREAAYVEQLSLRRELAGDAIAVAHYNLTHDTVFSVVSENAAYYDFLASHSLNEVISALKDRAFLEEDSKALDEITDQKSLVQQFYAGKAHISIRHYSSSEKRVYEFVLDLMQNPVTFDIEAFVQFHNVTEAAMTEAVARRLLQADYDTIVTIDAVTGKVYHYSGRHIQEVISRQNRLWDTEAGVAAYMRQYCADEDVGRAVRGTSLPLVREQLESKPSYQVTFSIRRDGKIKVERAVYTYLDNKHTTILCAIKDLTGLQMVQGAK